MTVDTCGPITAVYNCPLEQDLSTFLTVPCQINQGLLRKTMRIETNQIMQGFNLQTEI